MHFLTGSADLFDPSDPGSPAEGLQILASAAACSALAGPNTDVVVPTEIIPTRKILVIHHLSYHPLRPL